LKIIIIIIGEIFILITGWLYDKTESYNAPFIVAGINITIAGVMLALVICVTKRKRNDGCESEMKMTN
jgi:hypothetical protein